MAQVPAAADIGNLQLYTNGKVNAAIRLDDGSVIFAGHFTRVQGVARPSIARLNPSGDLDPNWLPPIDGLYGITSLAVDHAGYVYVATAFRLEKVSATGTGARDPAWKTRYVDRIGALVVDSANNLFAAGASIDDDQQISNVILKMSSTGVVDTIWKPVFGGSPLALALDNDGNLYAGGYFSSVNGATHHNLVKLAATGSGAVDANWSPQAQAASGQSVYLGSLALDGHGSLFVGGQFAAVGGQTRSNLAKLSTSTGAADPDWNAQTDGIVYSLAADNGGNLYVGGSFTSLGGQQRNNIGRVSVSGSGTVDAAWNPSTDNVRSDFVKAILADPSGRVFVGGTFSTIGGATRHSFAVVSASGAAGNPIDSVTPGGSVNAIVARPDGSALVGGYFSGAGNLVRNNLLRLLPDGSVDPSWTVATDAPSGYVGVQSIAVGNTGAIYIGGEFTQVGGLPRTGIAKLARDGTVDPDWGPGSDATGGNYGARAIAVDGNENVVIAGDFLKVGGVARTALARLSSHGVLDPQWNSANSFGSYVPGDGLTAVAVDTDGSVYAESVDGKLAKYAGSGSGAVVAGWSSPSSPIYGPIGALKLDGKGSLYVAGIDLRKVSTSDGSADPAWHVANFSGGFAGDLIYDAQYPMHGFYSLALDAAGHLYAGGNFFSVNSSPRPYVARLATSSGAVDPAWNPVPNQGVFALATNSKGDVYAGGDFFLIGNQERKGFAEIPADAGPGSVPNHLNQFGWTGAWYNPATGGQGFLLDVLPGANDGSGTLFGGWFTFISEDGTAPKPRWYSIQGPVDNTSKVVGLGIYATTYFQNYQMLRPARVGDMLLNFADCTHATLSYMLYRPGATPYDPGSINDEGFYDPGTFVADGFSIPLVRLGANIQCSDQGDSSTPADFSLSGAWYDPSVSYSGLLFDVDSTLHVFFAAWYLNDPQYTKSPGRALSNIWYTLQGDFPSGSTTANVPIYQTEGGVLDQPSTVTRTLVGTANLVFLNCNAVSMSYTFTAGASAGTSGLLNLTRGAGKPASCNP